MKKTLIPLLTLVLISCGNSNQNPSNSDSTSSTETKTITIESVELFKDLKGDIAVATQNLLNNKIQINNLLVFDTYMDTLGRRCLICVPFDKTNNKIGYLRSADASVGENKINFLGFWNPEEETDRATGRTQYFYNDTRLNKIYDKIDSNPDFGTPEVKENRITMVFKLKDANDFTGIKLPTYTEFMDGERHKHKAVFSQTIDMVGTVERLSGKKDNPSINLVDCRIVGKR